MPDERVLIADDEADVLDTCIRALAREGYQVQGASSGLEAVEIAKQQLFDLLVTDVRMPGITGLQTFRAIQESCPEIVGVVITAHGTVDAAIEALKLGMDDFLLKPFSLDELSFAVSKALEKKRLGRENARLRALIPLYQLSQAFIGVTDLNALLEQILRAAVQETGASLGVLTLKNETSGEWQVHAVVTDGTVETPSHKYELHQDIARQTVQGEQPVIWQADTGSESFFARDVAEAQVGAAIALPLIVKGETIGILSLGKQRKGIAFSRSDMELLSVLASQAAISIQNARLFDRMRQAYDKLAILDHMKSEFINIVAHELRTPLAEINAYLTLIEPQAAEREDAHVAAIARATKRLELIMNRITDLRFLEAQQVELQRAPFALSRLVSEVVEQLGPLAANKGQSLTENVPKNLPRVHADAPKIKIVLENLVTNAIEFTPRGGSITISAEAKSDALRISVQDTGSGIPPEEIEWVFKPFSQLENSLAREHGGLGTGLPIAKSLIELHGGTMWVDSVVGQGSTFHFTIPHLIS